MTKKFLATIVVLTMTLTLFAGFGVSAEVTAVHDFEDYSSNGITIPEGFVDKNNILNGIAEGATDSYQAISEVEPNGNKALQLLKGADAPAEITAGSLTFLKDVEEGISPSSIFQIKIKTNNATPGEINQPLNIGYSSRAFTPFNFRADGKIRGIGGSSASANISDNTQANKWYTVTFASIINPTTYMQHFESFVDGKFIEKTAETDAIESCDYLKSIQLSVGKKLAPGVSNSFDDIKIFEPGTLLAKINLAEGEKLPISENIEVKFNAPLKVEDPAAVQGIQIETEAGAVLPTTAKLSEDMTSVFLTSAGLQANTKYKVTVTGVTDLFGSTLTGVTYPFETANAARYSFTERFDGYTGTGLPDGWTQTTSTSTYYTVSSSEGGNPALNIKGNGGEGSAASVSIPVEGASAGNFAFEVKLKNSNYATETEMLYYKVGNLNQRITWKNLNGVRNISALGNASGSEVGQLVTNGGTLLSVVADRWYNVTVSSQMVEEGGVQVQKLSYWVDGVYHGYRYLSDLDDSWTEPAKITKIELAMKKQPGEIERTHTYDDISIYNQRALEIVDGVADGEQGVARDKALTFEFSAPILPANLSRITLTNGGNVIDADVKFAENSMTKVIVTPAKELRAETVYTVKMVDIEDVMGNTIASKDISFTSERIEGRAFDEINAELDAGSHVKGSVKVVNNVDEALSGKLYAAVFSGNDLIGSHILDIAEMSAQTSQTFNFDIDASAGGMSYYKVKFFVWGADFESLFPVGEETVGTAPSLFIIGDSTSANYDSSKAPLTGWGQVLPKYFDGDLAIKNRAVPGTSSRTYYDSKWQSTLDEMQAGDFLIIQFGHNDMSVDTDRKTDLTLASTVAPDPATSTYSYKWYMAQFIADAIDKGVTPVVATSIGRRIVSMDYTNDALLPAINAAREIAQEKGVELLDIYTEAVKIYKEYSSSDSKYLFMVLDDGSAPDNTHLRDYGAALVANAVKELILDSNLGIKAFAKTRVTGTPSVYIKNKFVSDIDVSIENGKVYLPLKEAAETLGATGYTLEGNTASFTVNSQLVTAVADSASATVEGASKTLTSAPVLRDGALYVSASFFGEALKFNVRWYDDINILGILQGGELSRATTTDDFESFVGSTDGRTAPVGYSISRGVQDVAYVTNETYDGDNNAAKVVANGTTGEFYLIKNFEHYDSRTISMKVKFDNTAVDRNLRLGIGDPDDDGNINNFRDAFTFGKDGVLKINGMKDSAEYAADTWYNVTINLVFLPQADGTVNIRVETSITDGVNTYTGSYIDSDTKGLIDAFRWQIYAGTGSMLLDDVVISPYVG